MATKKRKSNAKNEVTDAVKKSPLKYITPWSDFTLMTEAMFKGDPDVRVDFIDTKKGMKLYVKGDAKADAISKIMAKEKRIGNIVIKVNVVPANGTKRGKVKSRGGKSRDGKESVPAVEKEGFRLTAPAAVPDNRARGFSLEFAAEGRDGARRVKLVLAEGFNHAIAHPKATAPTGCAFAKDELPAGEVRFSVTPISCFGKRGAPLFTDWIRS